MKRLLTTVSLGVSFLTAFAAGTAGADVLPPDVWHKRNVQGARACPAGYICLYENFEANKEGGARMLALRGDVRFLNDYDFNDKTSSVVNKSNKTAVLYGDWEFGGPSATIRPGQRADFRDNAPMPNDWTSSVEVLADGTGGGDEWDNGW
jgi:hypothetical protein